MAADTPATSEQGNEAVANRLSRLNQRMDEAASANSRAKNIGRVMTFLIVIAAAIGVWFLVSPFMEAVDNPEPYQEAFQRELENSVIPAIEEELKSEEFQSMIEEVGNTALDKLKERDEEIYAAVDQQVRDFVDGMTEWGRGQLDERRTEIRSYIEDEVRAVAPELEDGDTAQVVLANASQAMDDAVNRIVDKYLKGHMAHMISIGDQIENFPVPEDVAQMSDDELSNELVDVMGAYSMSIFRTSISPETRDFLEEVSEENQ